MGFETCDVEETGLEGKEGNNSSLISKFVWSGWIVACTIWGSRFEGLQFEEEGVERVVVERAGKSCSREEIRGAEPQFEVRGVLNLREEVGSGVACREGKSVSIFPVSLGSDVSWFSSCLESYRLLRIVKSIWILLAFFLADCDKCLSVCSLI